MMYHDFDSLVKFKQDVARFLQSATTRPATNPAR